MNHGGAPNSLSERTRSLDEVVALLSFHETQAIVYGYLAELVADTFRGNEVKGPTKLLRTADGVRRADHDAILAIEAGLRDASARARYDHGHLRSSRVGVSKVKPGSSTANGKVRIGEGVQDATRPRRVRREP